eukprot:5323650-Pyramimonas_sp.AAC.1
MSSVLPRGRPAGFPVWLPPNLVMWLMSSRRYALRLSPPSKSEDQRGQVAARAFTALASALMRCCCGPITPSEHVRRREEREGTPGAPPQPSGSSRGGLKGV